MGRVRTVVARAARSVAHGNWEIAVLVSGVLTVALTITTCLAWWDTVGYEPPAWGLLVLLGPAAFLVGAVVSVLGIWVSFGAIGQGRFFWWLQLASVLVASVGATVVALQLVNIPTP